VIQALLPRGARVAFLVTGPADDGIDGYERWRMPGDRADTREMLESVASLEGSGIQFIVIPASAFDWLQEHPPVADHLRSNHRFVTRQEHLGEIYELRPVAAAEQPLQGSHENNSGKRSVGEMLRSIVFPSRRNGRRP
jgi:hypothetical protein